MLYLFDYVSISTNQFNVKLGVLDGNEGLFTGLIYFRDCFQQKPADFFLFCFGVP